MIMVNVNNNEIYVNDHFTIIIIIITDVVFNIVITEMILLTKLIMKEI